jgi:tetratricopeptide (TPR) repeat protein
VSRISRFLPARILYLAIGIIAVVPANASQSNRFISAYFMAGQAPSGPDFEIRSTLDLRIVSSRPVSRSRSVLVVIDQTGFSATEIRKHVSALAQALTQSLQLWEAGTSVRVGIPILDGILMAPIKDRREANRALETILFSYISDSFLSPDNSLGRTLDLIASLVGQAEDNAPLDCLILAKDRSFTEEGSAYLKSGAERRFLEVSSNHGSTFYGYLQGRGMLSDICLSTGGTVTSLENPGTEILREIMDGRSRGYVLKLMGAPNNALAGRFSLSVRARRSEQLVDARAPSALWNHPEGTAAPEYHAMREALDWLRRAEQAEKDGNLTVAMRSLDIAAGKDPLNPDLLYRAARVASASDDLELASRYLSRALQFDPCPENAVALYCEVMRRSGRPAEAIPALETMLRRMPEETGAIRLEHARLLASAGRLREAGSLYTAALQTRQEEGQVRAELGRVLWRLGDERGAREQLNAVLLQDPRNAAALIGQSEISLSEEKQEDALEFARRAVQADSKNPDAEAQLGKVYATQRDWKSAEQHLLQAIDLAPARKEFVCAMADFLFQAGRIPESVGVLRRLLSDNLSDSEIRRKLGDILVRAGRLAEAAAAFELGADSNKEEVPDLYLAAARLREKRGEYGQALLDYRAMLSSADLSRISGLNSLKQHVLHLSMALDGAQELPRLPVVRELGVEAAFAELPQTSKSSQTADEAADRSLIVPGGLDLLARTIGMSASEMQDPEALERICAFLAEQDRQPIGNKRNNPVRLAAVLYLRDFDDLLNYLKKTHLLAADFDPNRGQDLVLPLMGNHEVIQQTVQFLAFVGIKYRQDRSRAGRGAITLELRENEAAARRRQMLRNLGVDINRPDRKEIRLTIRDQEIPFLFSREVWSSQLPEGKDRSARSLLERTLASPQGIRLYAALASCSESVRDNLLKASARRELLGLADVLSIFGRYLDVREGRLVLPGAPEAWAALLGMPHTETGRFLLALLRNSRALLLYAGLSAAQQEVQEYFTASRERFQRLYDSMPSYNPVRLADSPAGIERLNIGRIMRQFTVRDGELQMAGDSRIAAYLLRATAQGPSSTHAGLDLQNLPMLLDPGREKPAASYSRSDTLELLRFLQAEHPQLMTDRIMAALMKDPAEGAVFLDLIGDLEPQPDLLPEYIEYCRHLARGGAQGWNVNRIRSSQSLFHLLSLLRREGAITGAESDALLSDALTQLHSLEEGEYAQALTRFLSTRLLPVLRHSKDAPANEDELILKSLAGSLPVRDFVFEGRRLRFDASALRLQKMKGAIQQQLFTPLSTLLEIYGLLDGITSGNGSVQELGASIARKLQEIRPAQLPADSSKTLRQLVASIDLGVAQSKLNDLVRSGGEAEVKRRLVQELAAALHPELGVTLLTYCYSYYGSPEIDTLAFDVNFIRKHDFLDSRWPRRAWHSARLQEERDFGSFVAGSVSGLGCVLARLETAPSTLGLTEEDAMLLPTMLAGMRAVRPTLRTERAQEYAALMTRLGRELLTLAVLQNGLREWCDHVLADFVPPRRRESVIKALAHFETGPLTHVLTPSEFFFLGEAYLRAVEDRRAGRDGEETRDPPAISCPVLDRLREIVADAARADAATFRKEVIQYGILLQRRLGLNSFTLASPESYEHLDRNAGREMLFERMCDLKIRLADLHYALGLPAFVAEVETELALRDILPRSEKVLPHGWKLVLDRINRLGVDNTQSWIEEAVSRGWLLPVEEGDTRTGVEPR